MSKRITLAELRKQASALKIPGRSKMNRAQLLQAVQGKTASSMRITPKAVSAKNKMTTFVVLEMNKSYFYNINETSSADTHFEGSLIAIFKSNGLASAKRWTAELVKSRKITFYTQDLVLIRIDTPTQHTLVAKAFRSVDKLKWLRR